MLTLIRPNPRPIRVCPSPRYRVVRTSSGRKMLEEINPPELLQVVIIPFDFGEYLRLAKVELGGEPPGDTNSSSPPITWRSGDGFGPRDH
jgi:hypothetical protein